MSDRNFFEFISKGVIIYLTRLAGLVSVYLRSGGFWLKVEMLSEWGMASVRDLVILTKDVLFRSISKLISSFASSAPCPCRS